MRIFSYEELDELGEGLIRQYLGKEAERSQFKQRGFGTGHDCGRAEPFL